MFPRLVNSTDTQLSAGFPESKCNDNSRICKVYAVTDAIIAVMFPRIENLTDTQLSAGFLKGTSFTGKFKLGFMAAMADEVKKVTATKLAQIIASVL